MDLDPRILTGGLAAVLAAVHLLAGRLRFLDIVPRSRWLSASSGVSVAYVFLHVLPDLAEHQETVREAARGATGFVEHPVYLIALAGMVLFYGLERLAKVSRGAARPDERAEPGTAAGDESTGPAVFWLHVASFGLYNGLIGYLLLRRQNEDTRDLLHYFAAMVTHFVVNDYGLRQHHRHRYDAVGRWVLAAAVVAGYVLGLYVEVHEAVVAVLFAFLAGGIVLNVLKEELPEERESRFWAFAGGAALYAILLILLSR